MFHSPLGDVRPAASVHPCEDPRDELETLSICWHAVADLLAPETDLHTVDRNHLAALLDYLAHRQRQAWSACQKSAA